ncbi:MAG: 2-isopropylmalate synthase [Nanoarchaeota archaeon]|nr:2-isopropylmalate synthase [Nanoarchaeota archaeon]
MGRVIIFDTTLRDGEQASGFHLYPEEKLAIAKQLARLRVDVIEAGFAASSDGDLKAIYNIAEEVGGKDGPVICSLARANEGDIELAARALSPAYNSRIHTFIATSDIHVGNKYHKNKDWIIEQTVKAVEKARNYTDDVEFSCEDFGRSDKDYIVQVVSEAINAGATTINLPDTIGWLMPDDCCEKVDYVITAVREKGLDAIFSVHNHNDQGMATAVTIAGIKAGARQAEVTINGIGERAGNTALEEIVAILKTRKIAYCNIDSKLIGPTSRLVSKYTGVEPQPNKAIVGSNAFAHEAGIHQDGMEKDARTYEIMDPCDYGVESIITFGPRSGRRALKAKHEELGIKLSDNDFQIAAQRFTDIADKLKYSDDADVVRAIKGEEIPKYYELVSYTPAVSKGYSMDLRLKIGNGVETVCSAGNGQIDAGINAIMESVNLDCEFKYFEANSKGSGSDAIGHTKLELTKNGWSVIGKSENTDMVTSTLQAFVDGCNRIKYMEDYFD